jgi:Fe-S-cluster containining protein
MNIPDGQLGITQHLKKMITNEPKILPDIVEGIRHYVNAYQEMQKEGVDRASCAHSFHQAINELVKDAMAQDEHKPSCKKGCSWCCYIDVEITVDEAELLLRHVITKKIPIDWYAVRRQAETKIKELPWKQRACVFLDRDSHECKVYEHRPMVCRKYFVVSDAAKCNSKKYPGGETMVMGINQAELMASAAYTLIKTGPMAKILLEVMNEGAGHK